MYWTWKKLHKITVIISAANPIHAATGVICETSDITGVVSFLVGKDSKMINGQAIAIDGGYSIQ